jgi:hypothetical protein
LSPLAPPARLSPAPGKVPASPATPDAAGHTVIGSGWSTIVETSAAGLTGPVGSQDSGPLSLVMGRLPAVKGTWGTGRLFTSTLLTGLITDDGRAFVGSVRPDALYRAAAK